MMIITMDFHPGTRLDSETGETGEQKLVRAKGDAGYTRIRARFFQKTSLRALQG